MGSKKDAGRSLTPDIAVALFRERMPLIIAQLTKAGVDLSRPSVSFNFVVGKLLGYMEENLAVGISGTRMSYVDWALVADTRTGGKKSHAVHDYLKKPFSAKSGVYGDRVEAADGWQVIFEIVTPGRQRGSGAGAVVSFYREGSDAPAPLESVPGAKEAGWKDMQRIMFRAWKIGDIEDRIAVMRREIDELDLERKEKLRRLREIRDLERSAIAAVRAEIISPIDEEDVLRRMRKKPTVRFFPHGRLRRQKK